MNIYAKQGDKVIYLNQNGSTREQEHANKFLEEGEIYTVHETDVHDWYTYVLLEEVPGEWFNSVLFEDYMEDIPVEDKDRDAEND